MVNLVEQMLEAQKETHSDKSKTETDKKLLQQRIDIIDKQIDTLVYELYGLTEEEIRIVEGGNMINKNIIANNAQKIIDNQCKHLNKKEKSRKIDELFSLLILNESIKLFSEKDILVCEHPDFIINNKIGIEITRLTTDTESASYSNGYHKSNVMQRIVDNVKNKYYFKNNPNLEARITFRDCIINKKREKKLVNEIVEIVENFLPKPGFSKTLEDYEPNELRMPPEIHIIDLRREFGLRNFHYQPNAVWLRDLKFATDKINECLLNKETNIVEYRKNCKEIWLVILILFIEGSAVYINNSIDDFNFETNFNRVFLIDRFTNFFELNVNK